MSVYDADMMGFFDLVLCFGTLYHLRYPMKGLDVLSQVCKGAIYIETAQLDDYSPYRGGLGQGYAKNDMVM